jgi:hypothetical protein
MSSTGSAGLVRAYPIDRRLERTVTTPAHDVHRRDSRLHGDRRTGVVMLLSRPKFAEFAKLPIGDPRAQTLALYCSAG